MEILGLILGADSIRKFALILGISLLVGGTLYPFKMKLELENEKLKLEEAQKLFDIDINNLEKKVENLKVEINNNTERIASLVAERDSLKKTNDPQVNVLNEQIQEINNGDKSNLLVHRDLCLEVERTKVKKDTMADSIEIIEKYLTRYWWFQWVAVVLGAIFFVFGIWKWRSNDKKSSDLFDTEHNIKKEELKKIIRENNPTP